MTGPSITAEAQSAEPAAAMADSAIHDSIAPADSIAKANVAELRGVVLANPNHLHEGNERISPAEANSWILLAMLALFITVSFKLKNNFKYFSQLFHELTDVRERGNAFDDTVRETSFLTLLNITCAMSCGILLYTSLLSAHPELGAHPLRSMLMCIGATSLYGLTMPLMYLAVGEVFSDGAHARLWRQGFVASQAVLGVSLFPLALASLFYPGGRETIIIISIALLIIAKILFITKGFRIFFARYSLWVTFLYYLCSLEIVPLILTYALAMWASCNML